MGTNGLVSLLAVDRNSLRPDAPFFRLDPLPATHRKAQPATLPGDSRARLVAHVGLGMAGRPSELTQPSPDSSLRIELVALQRAERALRASEPQQALEILMQCARVVPLGRMREERMAAAIIARCALSRKRGQSLIDEFARAYPASAYPLRVRRSCEPAP